MKSKIQEISNVHPGEKTVNYSNLLPSVRYHKCRNVQTKHKGGKKEATLSFHLSEVNMF